MPSPKIPLKSTDIRSESSFNSAIKPGGSDRLKVSYSILKTQVIYPFIQGFAWAVLKDWSVVFRSFAATKGSKAGLDFRHWLSSWLSVSRYITPTQATI